MGSSSEEGGSSCPFGRPEWTFPLQDVVIGSDVVCDQDSAKGVASILSLALKPEGEGLGRGVEVR